MATNHRVVITGMGIVSPLGNNPHDFFTNLMAGKSGVQHLQSEFIDQLDTKIAAQAQFDPLQHFSKHKISTLDRVSQFALYAAEQAIADAKLDLALEDKSRIGIFLGTGMGGATSMEEGYIRLYRDNADRLKPLTVLMVMNNAAASTIALEYGLTGPNLTFSTACSSSSVSIGEAFQKIRHGYADVMLAGGAEALITLGIMKAWEALRALASEDKEDPAASCKPFSLNRTGLVLGEGAAMFVLEDMEHAIARGAYIHAEVTGYGTGNDSFHITQPSAEGQSRAMRAALTCAGLKPEDIDYINAHGTATPLNDPTETEAIKLAFGDVAPHIPVSSTKSMHGHLMGATAAVEFVACVMALKQQALPPTINLHQPDPTCDLDYIPNFGRTGIDVQHVMSNSFAFGGTSGVLIASKVNY